MRTQLTVGVPELDLGGYLIPEEGQDPAFGASTITSVHRPPHRCADVLIGTKTPSMIDPFKLKYHEIPFRVPALQSNAGVTPDALLRAEVRVERVNVADVLGRMPALDNQV